MRRAQFSLKTLLWLTALVAAFCAGTRFDRYIIERRADSIRKQILSGSEWSW